MAARDAFLRALVDGDVRTLRRMWSRVSPHLPQVDAADGETCMHIARTATKGVPLKCRAYSHRWLEERGYPSQLPDKLKPQAERMYPRVASAAGFAWSSSSEILRPAKPIVDRAVGDRVEDLFANGDGDKTELVRREMIDTKNRTLKHLFGFRNDVSEVTR